MFFVFLCEHVNVHNTQNVHKSQPKLKVLKNNTQMYTYTFNKMVST